MFSIRRLNAKMPKNTCFLSRSFGDIFTFQILLDVFTTSVHRQNIEL